MSTHSFGRALRATAVGLAFIASPDIAHAQQASINVRVTEAANQRPVDQAQVLIVGTTLGGLTNAEGRFTFRAVAPGTHTIRVLRVGFAEQKKAVTVAQSQAASVDVVLSA